MEIKDIRKRIDRVDDRLLTLLARRLTLISKISVIKKKKNNKILDKKREKQIVSRLRKKAKAQGLSEKYVISLYKIILEYSRKEQENSRIRSKSRVK